MHIIKLRKIECFVQQQKDVLEAVNAELYNNSSCSSSFLSLGCCSGMQSPGCEATVRDFVFLRLFMKLMKSCDFSGEIKLSMEGKTFSQHLLHFPFIVPFNL